MHCTMLYESHPQLLCLLEETVASWECYHWLIWPCFGMILNTKVNLEIDAAHMFEPTFLDLFCYRIDFVPRRIQFRFHL